MDYEKKYKDALERAKIELNADTTQGTKNVLMTVFPELKESDDERIRKGIIDFLWKEKIFLQEAHSSVENNPKYRFVMDAIAWLEKQGEQKVSVDDFKAKNWYVSEVDGKIHDMTYNPAEKDEPKFKVGDWIISKYMHLVMQILNNDNGSYKTLETDGTERNDSYDFIERNFKLWTIDDAKDGDVLACGDKVTDCPFIFHNLTEKQNPRSYCGVNTLHHFQDNDENGGYWCNSDEVRPATKEQRDLLFAEIKEAGYQWDSEKKELKKLTQSVTKTSEQEEPQVYETGDGDIITYSETAGYKVEPKLKIESGKWYVCIKNLLDDYGNRAFCKGDVYLSEKDEYLIPCNSNVPWMIAYCVDTYFKEWTIKDAKDGDVLSNGKMIVIFKHFEEPSYRQRIVAYIGLDNSGDIQITDDTWTLGIDKANPATKEQRDLLFQKMKEDGYEWDAEKKELKLLISNGGDFESNNSKQKPTWSDEDEERLCHIHDFLFFNRRGDTDTTYQQDISWLETIKERLL